MKFGDVLRQLFSILAVMILNSASKGKIGGLNFTLKDGESRYRKGQIRQPERLRLCQSDHGVSWCLKWILMDSSAQHSLFLWKVPLPPHPQLPC